MQQLLVTRALSCSVHLACVRGPDRGCVFPVEAGGRLGRESGLRDPFTARKHLSFERSPNGFVAIDRGSVNRVLPLRGRLHLKNGRILRVGSNVWQVRELARFPGWLPPTAQVGARLIRTSRYLLPVLLLLGLARFLGPPPALLIPVVLLAATGGATVLFQRLEELRRRRDPASLLINVANLKLSESTLEGSDAPLIYRRPGRGTATHLESLATVAVVGDRASEFALWIAGQLFSAGIAVFVESRGNDGEPSPGLTRIIWARTVEELSRATGALLGSTRIAGSVWKSEMDALLRPTDEDALPSRALFEDIYGDPEASKVRVRWTNGDPDAVIGSRGGNSHFAVNLDRDGPHVLVVGGTGSGKSELLTCLLFALANQHPPDDLRFLLMDYKGGAGLLGASKLPHSELLLTDLDGAQTPWLLRVLAAQIRLRKKELLAHGFRSVEEWRSSPVPGAPPRLVVVADEVKTLADHSPELLKQLAQIGAQGRSLGIHLILATQRPGGVISSDMRAILDLRVALRCSEVSDSLETIATREAFDLPRIPGRALVRTETGIRPIQSALVTDPQTWITELTLAAEAIGAVRAIPRPLPDHVAWPSGSSSNGAVIGFVEDNETAQIEDLVWDGQALMLVSAPPLLDESARCALAAACTANRVHPSKDRAILWASTVAPDGSPLRASLGDVCRLLEQCIYAPSAADSAIVVIPQLGPLIQQLQTKIGVERSQSLQARLIELANCASIRLIVTETTPGTRAGLFPWRTYRFCSQEQLANPHIAASLPTEFTAGAGKIGSVSSVPGRVLVQRPNGSVSHAQLAGGSGPIPAFEGYLRVPRRLIELPPGVCGLSIASASSPRPALVVISDCESHLDSVTDALGGPHLFSSFEHLHQSAWMSVVTSPRKVVAAVEPSRELTRLLLQASGSLASWPLASVPFPKGCGFVCYEAAVGTLVLPGNSDRDR